MNKTRCFGFFKIITLILFLFLKIACFGGGDEQENFNNLEEIVNNEEDFSEEESSNEEGELDQEEEDLNLQEDLDEDNNDNEENINNNLYQNNLNQNLANIEDQAQYNESEPENVQMLNTFDNSAALMENNSQLDLTNDLAQEALPESLPLSEDTKVDVINDDISVISENDLNDFPSRGVAGPPAAEGLPEIGSKMPYVVKKGDTLSKIAARIFGDSKKWKHLADFTGLKNPNMIYPGEVIYYQLLDSSLDFAKGYANQDTIEVVVKEGDTLSKIAERHYGEKSFWKFIWRQNDSIEEPDNIKVGQVLTLVDNISFVVSTQDNEEYVFNVSYDLQNSESGTLLSNIDFDENRVDGKDVYNCCIEKNRMVF